MTTLALRFTKHADGSSMLQCTRADGSVTAQRHAGQQAAFFPVHDLTHFAVESELGFAGAFFGLVAAGWDIADTTGKGRRGPIPPDAMAVEYLVGALDLERAGSVEWTAESLNAHARAMAEKDGRPAPRELSDPDLDRVRAQIRSLLARWASIPPGGTLDLSFDSSSAPARRS